MRGEEAVRRDINLLPHGISFGPHPRGPAEEEGRKRFAFPNYDPARVGRHEGHHLRADYFHEVKVVPLVRVPLGRMA